MLLHELPAFGSHCGTELLAWIHHAKHRSFINCYFGHFRQEISFFQTPRFIKCFINNALFQTPPFLNTFNPPLTPFHILGQDGSRAHQGRSVEKHRGRGAQSLGHEVRKEPMGADRFASDQKNTETMQGTMVRVARSVNQENRVGARGGREAAASGQTHAHAMAHHSSRCWQDSRTVSGALSASA